MLTAFQAHNKAAPRSALIDSKSLQQRWSVPITQVERWRLGGLERLSQHRLSQHCPAHEWGMQTDLRSAILEPHPPHQYTCSVKNRLGLRRSTRENISFRKVNQPENCPSSGFFFKHCCGLGTDFSFVRASAASSVFNKDNWGHLGSALSYF